jgi:hypothetical protein
MSQVMVEVFDADEALMIAHTMHPEPPVLASLSLPAST